MQASALQPIRVFLVDDHRATLWGLERLIDSASDRMRLVGSATSIGEMFAAPGSKEADVIVLDLDLGGDDSTACMGELQRTLDAQVLVLTGARDEESHRRAVLGGARGVVKKEEPVDVLLRAIEKIHEGEIWLNRTLIGSVMNALTGAPAPAAPANPEAAKLATLTPKEQEVIAAVVRHRGAKSLVIADELGISEHTLRNHLTVIYHKLEVRGRLELYLYAQEHGLAGTAASGVAA